jgi:hypothetical protein
MSFEKIGNDRTPGTFRKVLRLLTLQKISLEISLYFFENFVRFYGKCFESFLKAFMFLLLVIDSIRLDFSIKISKKIDETKRIFDPNISRHHLIPILKTPAQFQKKTHKNLSKNARSNFMKNN